MRTTKRHLEAAPPERTIQMMTTITTTTTTVKWKRSCKDSQTSTRFSVKGHPMTMKKMMKMKTPMKKATTSMKMMMLTKTLLSMKMHLMPESKSRKLKSRKLKNLFKSTLTTLSGAFLVALTTSISTPSWLSLRLERH